MGISMKLAVGYGLNLAEHAKLDRAKLNFERLEEPSLWVRWRDTLIEFSEKHEIGMDGWIFNDKMNPPASLSELAVYDDEGADPDRLVLMPSNSRGAWFRRGNHLDAFVYEAEQNDLEFRMDATWIPHPGTLYPYIGLMRANPDEPLGIEKYWVPCYRDHPEHKNAIAWAPWHLWFWLRTVFDLTETETTEVFLSLRPGVYRFWS